MVRQNLILHRLCCAWCLQLQRGNVLTLTLTLELTLTLTLFLTVTGTKFLKENQNDKNDTEI